MDQKLDRNRILETARAAYDRGAWEEARAAFGAATVSGSLGQEDLERLAVAAVLTGRDVESDNAWLDAYRRWLDAGAREDAARCLFWLTFRLLNSGLVEQAGGWITRTNRLLQGSAPDCLARGRLTYLTGLAAAHQGDWNGAVAGFEQAAEIATCYSDGDLLALGHTGLARVLLRLDRRDEGVALLDDVMVGLGTDDLSALVVGDLYCTAVEACYELADVHRAREWTAALSRWCEAQPQLVRYRGQCLVHRSEMLQLAGDWVASMDQAHRARAQLSTPRHQLALGAACYQLGDLHRLRGEVTQAEDAYRLASLHGRDPQPGLALLRLTQRRTDAAATMSRRVVTEPCDRSTRVQILCGHVEIMIAVGDHGAARDAAGELGRLVADMPGPWLQATSSHAWGLVHLAEGEPAEALRALRRAQEEWVAIDAPYQAARTRVLVAAACDALLDPDSATVERRAARAVFEELGAVPDARGLVEPTGHDQVLSGREIEVLRLVARGLTNRAIGARLVLSERTVERHLSNIFHKVDVPSRAAATAYAFEHGLV